MAFEVFVRNWWIRDASHPERRVPGPGRKTVIHRRVETAEEARRLCKEYNDNHEPGFLSRKAEFQSL